MSTISEYSQQAELAFAAYADLFSGMSDKAYNENLVKAGMSET